MTLTTSTFAFTSTTTLAEVASAYAAADVSTKAAMRADHKAAVFAAAMAVDGDLASHLVSLDAGMVATKAAPAPVDYASRVADRIATLESAIQRLRDGFPVLPEGVTVDLTDADLTGGTVDAREVERLVVITGRKAGRGSVADWLDSVLGDEPMSIADLRSAWVATEDYPKSAPSAGAIGACLDRDGAAEFGIEVCEVGGRKGAIRTV